MPQMTWRLLDLRSNTYISGGTEISPEWWDGLMCGAFTLHGGAEALAGLVCSEYRLIEGKEVIIDGVGRYVVNKVVRVGHPWLERLD